MRFAAMCLAAAATVASAQRPNGTSICDYYTQALLKENTAEKQASLLTLLVNTVLIGNYTTPNVGVEVPGILAPGEVNGVEVKLLSYFNGGLKSSNTGGKEGASVSFLDGGGAEPLKKSQPAIDNTSRQYFLLMHLYQFFGSLLGCSMQGMPGFDAYSGQTSMYKVHKFMGLSNAEMTYFIEQVGMAAASFGVAKNDIAAVADSLNSLFNVRCAAPTAVIKGSKPELQSMCLDVATCPEARIATCGVYDKPTKPRRNGSSLLSAPVTMSSTETTMSGAMTMPTSAPAGGSAGRAANLAGVAAGLAALLL